MRSFYKRVLLVSVATVVLLAAVAMPAAAQTTFVPTAITAEQAFDAVSLQKDPMTGDPVKVVLVDVRSRAEYYWVGTAAKVTGITLENGTVVVPDGGKVKLEHNGMFLTYHVDGSYKRMMVQKVKAMTQVPLAYNIPFQKWDEGLYKLMPNPDFAAGIVAIATDKPALILYCRSGGRTDGSNCVSTIDPTLFSAIYEIDQALPATNYGGFEGSNYGNAFNGYRGFPERDTANQAVPSVSWKDAGLPIVIGAAAPALPAPPPPPASATVR